MHKIGVLIDRQTRKYVSDYLEGMTVPEDCEVIYSFPEDGLFEPTYDDETGTWKHGLTQEEIDAIRNAPQPETPEQKIARLEEENANLFLELAATQAQAEQTEQTQAELLLMLVEKGVI